MDDIVEEVGEENVVQIVTDGADYYEAAGEMLMKKRTRLYWTPCATRCIEMILKDYEKIPIYKETKEKCRTIIMFIYSTDSLISLMLHFTRGIELFETGNVISALDCLSLCLLHENKRALIRMFVSKKWKSRQRQRMGNRLRIWFWKNVMICYEGANPVVQVLHLANSIGKPAIGFIYEAMEKAKEEIRRRISKGDVERYICSAGSIINFSFKIEHLICCLGLNIEN
jgi:hypothetical protein